MAATSKNYDVSTLQIKRNGGQFMHINGKKKSKAFENDPYAIFFLVNNGGKYKIISPFLGKCMKVGNDGEIKYSISCGTDTVVTLNDKSGQLCNETGTCVKNQIYKGIRPSDQYGAFWNIEKMNILSRNTNDPFIRKIAGSTFSSNPGFLDYLKGVITVKAGKNTYKYEENPIFVNQLYTETVNKSIVGGENTTSFWPTSTYLRQRRPISIILCGDTAIGKSRIVTELTETYRLFQPIHLSYDTSFEIAASKDSPNIASILTHIEKFIDNKDGIIPPIKLTDPGNYATFLNTAAKIGEEVRKFAVNNNIDTISERGTDLPKISEIKNIARTRDVFVYIYISNMDPKFLELRRKRVLERFNETGRNTTTLYNMFQKDKVMEYANLFKQETFMDDNINLIII